MEEAVEIAKLRLFLALVASAERRDHLEPLPNIEFNLMQGNSLIGLLHVDPKKFDSSLAAGAQGRMTLVHQPTSKDLGFSVESKPAPTTKEKVGAHLAEKRTRKYDELLREKNRLIDNYKKAALNFEDLTALKDSIEAKKREARDILDKLLLDEFVGLGIQFEQATWDVSKGREGKPEKRRLKIDDVKSLKPFHWAYEFDEIIVNREGFDAIITNPPWEIFKPNSKEFFEFYSDLVRKKKMRIEEFDKAKDDLLEDKDTRASWLSYLSDFPHVSAWYRQAPQYNRQVSYVSGKKVGSDVNLYKVFLEQTFNLLRAGSHCGILTPGGLYTDLGTKALREALFESATIQSLFGLSNEKFIFQDVHHAQKFVILAFKKGGETKAFTAAFRINPREAVEPKRLETFLHSEDQHVTIPVELIRRSSPDSLSIMELKGATDVVIVEKMLVHPLLGENQANTWNARFSAEFHMTNDSDIFRNTNGRDRLPLSEGKMIWQFQNNYSSPRYWVDEREGRKRLLGRESDTGQTLPYQSYRIGVRAVSGNVNERTLVSTVMPPSFFGNSLLAVSGLDERQSLALQCFLASYVVDALLRMKVSQNVNIFYLKQLPVPRIDARHSEFRTLIERVARLIGTSAEFDGLLKQLFGKSANHRSHGVTDEAKRRQLRAEIDAIVAQLYNLTEEEFAHILSTFPLVPQEVKALTLNTFIAMSPSADDKAVHKLIKGLETDKVEFKEAATFSAQRNQKSPDAIQKVVREVAAFLNSGGGNVILGVTDAGKIVGIANDIQHANPKKKNRDGYELFLRDSIGGKLGTVHSSACKITFHKIDNHEVCRILVPAASAPVYLDGNVIIRDGTSSRALSAQEAADYIAVHWPRP